MNLDLHAIAESHNITPDANFGIYAALPNRRRDGYMLAAGNTPAGANGAMLIDVEYGGFVRYVHVLNEQGVFDMLWCGQRFFIPGCDPTDDWTLGNMYIVDRRDRLIKYRAIDQCVHVFGQAIQGCAWYAAGRGHDPDTKQFYGMVARSDDFGANWENIIRYGSGFYQWDYWRGKWYGIDYDALKLWLGGDKFEHVAYVQKLPRSVIYQDQLIYLDVGGYNLTLIDNKHNLRLVRLPHQVDFNNWQCNSMAVGGGRFYILTVNGIMTTRNFSDWQTAAKPDALVRFIAYDYVQNRLVYGNEQITEVKVG